MAIRTVVCGALSAFLACSAPPEVDQNVVARVGDVEISFDDLQGFKAGLPALLLSEKQGVGALEEYLQSMVDMELMLLEARLRELAADPEFTATWEEEREKKLFKEFVRIEIQDKIDLPKEEIRRQWDASKWSKLLKLARIRTSSADEAAAMLRALEGGTSFAELSGPHLTHSQAGRHQGVLESYFGRGNIEDLGVSLDAAEAIFELAEGEVSAPLKVETGYDIYKVLDVRPAPASYYLVFSQGAMIAAYAERRRELSAELIRQYQVEINTRAVGALAERIVAEDSAELAVGGVLGTFEGGQIRVADFMELYPKVRRVASVGTDSSGIDEFVRSYLVPELLFPVAIERRGLADEPEVADWLQRKQRAMLIEELRLRDVEERVDLSEATLRKYYEANPKRFMQDQEASVLEILVATREEAEALLARIRAGEDMAALAAAHSIRQGGDRFHLHSFEKVPFGELLPAVLAAPVGKLQGPVAITATEHRQGGFSLFKVLDKTDAAPKPYAEAEKQVRYWWTRQEENRLYGELLDRLREKHAARIAVYRDHLVALHGASQS